MYNEIMSLVNDLHLHESLRISVVSAPNKYVGVQGSIPVGDSDFVPSPKLVTNEHLIFIMKSKMLSILNDCHQ